jgi:hypothetical protein
MGISILSYRGAATLAVVADAHLVPDPETITARFNREFATMLAAVRRREQRKAPGRAGPSGSTRGAATKGRAGRAKTGSR